MRIAKSDVNAVLQKTAQRIIDAGGSDGRTSRAEMNAALKGLSGKEKTLADVFFRFVDHRDFKSGAQVTPSDVKKAVAYAKVKMIAAYDLDNNGLSRTEISKMSLTGKLAVDLARSLKAAAPVKPSGSAADFAKQLATLSKGVEFDHYGSEAGAPWKAFDVKFDGGALDAKSFAKAMKLPAGPKGEVTVFSAKEYFDAMTGKGPEPVVLTPAEQAIHQKLADAMNANLKDVKIFMVGADSVVQGQVYLVGKAADGNLSGLSSTRIYT